MSCYKVLFSFQLDNLIQADLKWWREALKRPSISGKNAWLLSTQERFAAERGLDLIELPLWPRFKYRVSRQGPELALYFWSDGAGDVGDLVFLLHEFQKHKGGTAPPCVVTWAEVNDIGGATGSAVVVTHDDIFWYCARALAAKKVSSLLAKKTKKEHLPATTEIDNPEGA